LGEGGRPDLQNITYKYDNVGNITNRKNNGFNTNDDVVRNSEQSYEYDNMDRLTESSGKFNYETWNPFWDKRVNTYTSEYTYSKTGKILQKAQENKGLLQETNETVTIAETTYNWNYEYTGAHPNAVTKAGPRTYSYDLNGNMTEMKDSPLTPGGGTTTMTRTLTWDDENRLLKTTDSPRTPGGGKDVNVVTTYSYDAAGMRALKKGKYGTVQYVSDNYTVRNKDLISKHVFAGNTRLVSKTVMREEKSGKMTATEQGAYYYHPDHLGSSNVVTDKDGRFYEQIEYFPYGETWINNKATAEQTSSPYKFTAKEYDPETGWYYYGARYYDAKLSRWISADPPLARGDYLPVPPVNDKAKEQNSKLPGMGGVFNTINLDAYHYAGQNPVKLLDPDGNWDDRIHHDATIQWAQDAGFSETDANKIAHWNSYVDKIESGKSFMPNIGDQSYHFNTDFNDSIDTRLQHGIEHLRNAIDYENKSKEFYSNGDNAKGDLFHNLALRELGFGLHAIQDITGHPDELVKEIKDKKGRAPSIFFHDSPELNGKPNLADDLGSEKREMYKPERLKRCENNTKIYLEVFKEQTK